jgi:hypothetical protein
MKRLAKLFALAILALACEESGARESMRVLFVGNSLTYYNNLPGMVESIYESTRPNATLHTELLASGGALIRDHLTTGHLAQILAKNRFDVVVLQELGGFPACPADFRGCSDSPAALHEAIALVRAAGARAILFGTWQATPESQRELSAATKEMAARLQVDVADVGAAMQSALTTTNLQTLDKTGHPLPQGSWLAAIVLTKAIAMADVRPNPPAPVCQADWTGHGPSENSLASRQEQPPAKCYYLSEAEFNRLRAAADAR